MKAILMAADKRSESLSFPGHLSPTPKIVVVLKGEGGKEVEFYDAMSIFFKFRRKELPVLSRNVLHEFK